MPQSKLDDLWTEFAPRSFDHYMQNIGANVSWTNQVKHITDFIGAANKLLRVQGWLLASSEDSSALMKTYTNHYQDTMGCIKPEILNRCIYNIDGVDVGTLTPTCFIDGVHSEEDFRDIVGTVPDWRTKGITRLPFGLNTVVRVSLRDLPRVAEVLRRQFD